MRPEGRLRKVLEDKSNLGRTIAFAALIAFAVSTLSSLCVNYVVIPRWILWALALSILIIGLFIFLARIISSTGFSYRYDGAVFIDRDFNKVVKVEDYNFSEEIVKVIEAVKAENPAIYADWEKEPILDPRSKPGDRPKPENSRVKEKAETPSYLAITRIHRSSQEEDVKSASLFLEEVALFVVLEMLSTHLGDFYNKRPTNDIKEFRREDFPAFLMRNRILNLLSTPIEERPIFLKAFPDPDKRPEGEIFHLWGSDGAVFSRFDLSLPKGSTLEHKGRNGLKISTKRLSIELEVNTSNSSAIFSPRFCKNYMKRDFKKVDGLQIFVRFSGKINPIYLLRSKGWELYEWMDSFSQSLSQRVDFDDFLERISWHSVIEPSLIANAHGAEHTATNADRESGGLNQPNPNLIAATPPADKSPRPSP